MVEVFAQGTMHLHPVEEQRAQRPNRVTECLKVNRSNAKIQEGRYARPGQPLCNLCAAELEANVRKRSRGHSFKPFTHEEGRVSGLYGRMWAGRGSTPCGLPHRKLEPTDVIQSYSRARKLGFITRISSLNVIKTGYFSSI